jgi:heterodisulfide reductase subunit A-like polyferredoxin
MSPHDRLDAIGKHLDPERATPLVEIDDQAQLPAQYVRQELPDPRTIFPPLQLEEHPIDETRSLRVVVVGAGIAGITSAILLPAKVPKIDLVIYERESDVVGHFPVLEPLQIVPN